MHPTPLPGQPDASGPPQHDAAGEVAAGPLPRTTRHLKRAAARRGVDAVPHAPTLHA
jgi:hypothetical protein